MTEQTTRSSNVISLTFGSAQRELPFVDMLGPRAEGVPSPAERPADPVASVYSRADVARLFGLDGARLRAWERAGLARPSAEEAGTRWYTFQDLVAVRTAKGLVERGVPIARIRRALEALRKTLPGTARLSELRIVCDGKTLAVKKGNSTFDPITGQLLLDFDVSALREDVVRTLPVTRQRRDARTAYDYFLDGCRLDADEAARSRAEAAYRKAIQLDPMLASAYTNLGTLRMLQGDVREAEALFQRAIAVDPGQTEAPYNLGYLKLEQGRYAEAAELLSRATEIDPDFADGHFNLAVALYEMGRVTDALPHWACYLELDPNGDYARIAREHLRKRARS